jgi:hypothetical protein
MIPPVQNARVVVRHDKKVKGASFKNSVDVESTGIAVVAPFKGKIAHVYPDKIKCGNPVSGSAQIIVREEYVNAKGDRKFTGRAVQLAHFVPGEIPRHVEEGFPLGLIGPGAVLHVGANRPGILPELGLG